MSHELRTPLNSLLILSQDCSPRTPRATSPAKQVEFAQTIHAAGADLLGADQRHPRPVEDRVGHDGGRRRRRCASRDLRDYVERTFRQVAEDKGLELRRSSVGPDLPRAIADRREAAAAGAQEPALERVQVHRARAASTLQHRAAPPSGWSPDHAILNSAERVVAFAVQRHRHRHPAGQAAASSSRRSSRPTAPPAASTAAPASASRSAARSRGCSAARSGSRATPGEGSTFTLYLPLELRGRRAAVDGAAPWTRPTLGAAPPRRPRRPAARRGRGRRRRLRRAAREVDDDRGAIQRGRPRAAHRRGRRRLRARSCCDLRAGRGLQGARGAARRRGAGAGARVPARRRSRSTSACRTWTAGRVLDRLKHDPAHAPHPGARHLRRTRTAQRGAAAGRASATCAKPRDAGGAGRGARRRCASFVERPVKQPARRRGRRGAARSHRRAARQRATCRPRPWAPATRRSSRSPSAALRLRGARPRPAGHDRRRAASSSVKQRGRLARPADHRLHGQAS